MSNANFSSIFKHRVCALCVMKKLCVLLGSLGNNNFVGHHVVCDTLECTLNTSCVYVSRKIQKVFFYTMSMLTFVHVNSLGLHLVTNTSFGEFLF